MGFREMVLPWAVIVPLMVLPPAVEITVLIQILAHHHLLLLLFKA